MKFGVGKGQIFHMKTVNFDVIYEMRKAEMILAVRRKICGVIQQKVKKGLNLVSGGKSKEIEKTK